MNIASFKSYSGKQNATRALTSTYNMSPTRASKLLAERAGKWGFYVNPDGSPVPFAVKAAEAAKKAASSKSEKTVRVEKNGIQQPAEGGICRAIWDYCTAFKTKHGAAPTLAEMRTHNASVKEAWSPVTMTIQYYQWRKFNGIVGRSQK